jgi:ATP/maltotriose-dependent transcriptional regulator MalT
MKLLDHNTEKLKDIWVNPILRQNAEVVIMTAISLATDLSVADADKVLDELERLLEDEEEDKTQKKDRAL